MLLTFVLLIDPSKIELLATGLPFEPFAIDVAKGIVIFETVHTTSIAEVMCMLDVGMFGIHTVRHNLIDEPPIATP